MPQTKIQGKFYPLKSSEWIDSINQLTHSELKILYYVRSLDPYNNGIDLSASQIARDLSTDKNKMHRSTVGRALKELERKKFIEPGLYSSHVTQRNLEAEITDLLFKQLGGLTEVSTPAGRIDLLTDNEIIEVKRITDWKARTQRVLTLRSKALAHTCRLGQILVYSAFYPEHQKRDGAVAPSSAKQTEEAMLPVLFGRHSELIKLPDIEAATLAFDVAVTAEEVK